MRGTLVYLIAMLCVAMLVVAAMPAIADCTAADGVINSNDTITCDGVDPNGVTAGTGTNEIIINEGAVVNDTVISNPGGTTTTTVNNHGTVDASGNGVDIWFGEVNNHGTVEATGTGITAEGDVNNHGTVTGDMGIVVGVGNVTNTGTVNADADGVSVLEGNVDNSGIINSGGDYGVYVSTGNVTNSGLINTSGTAVEITIEGNVTNTGDINARAGIKATEGDVTNTGSIMSEEDGISVTDGNINNTGSVISSAESGIAVTGTGNVTNTGTIMSVDEGITVGYGNVTNAGSVITSDRPGINVLEGNVTNTGTVNSASTGITISRAGNVTNSGTIIGQNGVAIQGGTGDNVITLQTGSLVMGSIDGGGVGDQDTLIIEYAFESEDFYIPEQYQQIREMILNSPRGAACPATGCVLSFIVDGVSFTYVHSNFENLDAALHMIKVTFTPYDEMSCQNGVRCFALKNKAFRNGTVQVYATAGDQGIHVANINFLLLGTGGYRYTNPANGWTVEVAYAGVDGDAKLYSMTLSNGTDIRNANIEVLVFSNNDLAWR